MNNREEWSQTEREMQKLLDKVRKEHPEFWAQAPELPQDCKEGIRLSQEKKLRKRRRRAAIAAVCALCTFSSMALTLFIQSDTAHAMKFALEKKYYEVSGMVSATNPERVNGESKIVTTVTEEAEIESYKRIWDGIETFGYIPEGYQFKKMEIIKHLSGIVVVDYFYENHEKDCFSITIRNFDEEKNNVLWTTSEEVRNGSCEYREWEDEMVGTKGIDVLLSGKLVIICGKLNEDQLFSIINGMG